MVFAAGCAHKKAKVEDTTPPPQATNEEFYEDIAAKPTETKAKPKAKKKAVSQKKKTAAKKY